MGDNGTKLVALMPAVVFVLIALLETMQPRRALRFGRLRRWTTSLILFVCNRATVLLLAWIIAVPAAAFWAETKGIGLFNQIALPLWAEWLSAFLLLDFAMWLQHRLTHKVPLLWRFHKVHHADPDFDLTTGIRFHPMEMLLSAVIKLAAVAALGAPAAAVLIFEVLLNATAMFNHANVALPATVEPWVRKVLVTPDMHRIHHSVLEAERNSNYGFCLSIWDRLLGTNTAAPRGTLDIGLADRRDPAMNSTLDGVLRMPFRP